MRHQHIKHTNSSALQTWYTKQSSLLKHQANIIRDSLLQELFALRRSLEFVELKETKTKSKQYQVWIQQLESLYSSLSSLTEAISPSLAEFSLPSAVSFHLKQFTLKNRDFEISINQSSNWSQDSISTNKLLLAFLQDLAEQAIVHRSVSSMGLVFNQRDDAKSLGIKLNATYGGIIAGYQDYIFDIIFSIPAIS